MRETRYAVPGCPLRIALLTDLHNRPFERIIASLRSRRPEIIAVAGDVLRSHAVEDERPALEKNPNALPFFSACASIAPTFFSLGNHEWILSDGDLERVAATGAHVLDNTWTEYRGVQIGGLTSSRVVKYRRFLAADGAASAQPHRDFHAVKSTVPAPDLGWLEEFCRQDGYRILLCHQPEYERRFLAPYPLDLVLSGHAHGGQIRLYSFRQRQWRGLYAPGQGFRPERTSGVHGRLVISRGLSNTVPIPRLNNPTEIVYIEPEE
ncbi:MAG: metallophosphoesterase [Oscillospiraceae bacterium]|nr:metallophosphoesterase [Oscillospiraceae bacterium]